jgi:hypothetical protein
MAPFGKPCFVPCPLSGARHSLRDRRRLGSLPSLSAGCSHRQHPETSGCPRQAKQPRPQLRAGEKKPNRGTRRPTRFWPLSRSAVRDRADRSGGPAVPRWTASPRRPTAGELSDRRDFAPAPILPAPGRAGMTIRFGGIGSGNRMTDGPFGSPNRSSSTSKTCAYPSAVAVRPLRLHPHPAVAALPPGLTILG